ncbi:MAG: DUF4349 domain-containing protein [Myxococcota bacterium]|jgi:hypothetical protein|nr:DUF4349 domain-containing protein [Myxococcota bacterium]
MTRTQLLLFVCSLQLTACGGAMSAMKVSGMAESYREGGYDSDSYLRNESADFQGPLEKKQAAPATLEPIETALAEDGEAQPVADDAKPTTLRRMVIYTAHVTMSVVDLPKAMSQASTAGEALGGWIQASSTDSLVLRVPAERFRDFLASVRELGTVVDEDIVGQDVTEEFLDLEIRLRNALALRDRFEALLVKANSVADTLAIETELARITTQIEQMKGRLRYLQQQIAFSTVHLNFTQPQGSKSTRIRLPFSWLSAMGLHGLYQVEVR